MTPTPTTPGAASRYGVDELESVRAAHAEYPPLDVARLNEDARSQVLLGEFKDALASSRQTDAEYRDMVLQAHTNYTYMWQTRFNMAGSLYVQSTETDAVKNMKYGHYASTQYSAAMRHFHDDQNAKHFQLFGIPMAISGPGHPISQVSATLINCRTTHFALWLQTIIELRKASVQVLPDERICSSLRDTAHRSDLTRLVTNCKNAKRQVDSLIKDQASLTVVINEWRKVCCQTNPVARVKVRLWRRSTAVSLQLSSGVVSPVRPTCQLTRSQQRHLQPRSNK